MNVANLGIGNVRDQLSKDEWDARVNLAAAYRLVALYGHVTGGKAFAASHENAARPVTIIAAPVLRSD